MPDPAAAPQKMGLGKRVSIELAVGAVLGFVAWSLIGPVVISWWYEPPSRDAFSCASSVKKALEQFVLIEMVAAGSGAVVLTLFLFVMRRIFKKPEA